MVSPLKKAKSYGGKPTPAGVDGISMGKNGKGLQTAPKIMKGAREAGKMYKEPGNIKQQGKNAKDMSSGQSNPVKGSSRDKVKYTQAKQSIAYSNAEIGAGKCKFVC